MQSICYKIIRVVCPCLIQKAADISYPEVNDEQHKFISLSDHCNDEQRGVNRLLTNKSQKKSLAAQINKPRETQIQNLKLKNQFEKYSTNDQNINSVSKVNQQAESLPILDLSEAQLIQSQKHYGDVILAQHPYYHIFKDKLALLPRIFQLPQNADLIKPDTSYPLKIYCQNDGKVNIFKYFFEFPCDFETYQTISSDFELQKQFDPNIEEFKKIIETPQKDAKLIYLSYKKILIISPRDFEYARYTFKKYNQYWNICASDLSKEEIKGRVRGEIILTATKIIQNSGKIYVSVYSQIDTKTPIKLQMGKSRGLTQIRKYLDKIYNYITTNQDKSII